MDTTEAPNRRLIKWFIGTTFFTFVVLMHVSFPNLGGTGLRMPFNATVWMGFGVMMALAMCPATRGVIRYSAFHKGLGLLLLALWLPFLWSWNEASLIALPRMLTVTAGAILLLGLAQLQLTQRDWWWIGMAILAGTLLETALCYAQLYLLEPGNWLGYDVERQQPYGIFQQRNVLASFLVTGLAVSAWLIGEAQRGRERAATLLAPLFMPAILWFAGSVTGWLATLVVLPLLLIHLRGHDRHAFKLWGIALLLGILFAAALWALETLGSPRSLESFATTSGYRKYVFNHSLKMIAEQPLFGWGYGRFMHEFLYSFADWRANQPINQPQIIEPYLPPQTYDHPHNELLLWGIEGGLLPMLAIIAFASWILWRLSIHGPRGQRLLLASTLFPLSIHSMTEFPFYHSQASWLAFILLSHGMASRCWRTSVKNSHYTFIVKVGSYVAAPALVFFMATHMHTLWKAKIFSESNGEKASALAEVINPLGTPRLLDFIVMSKQLQSSTTLGTNAYTKNYLSWAKARSETEPNPVLHANMIVATHSLEEASNKEALIKEAIKLFPISKEVKNAINETKSKHYTPEIE